MADDILSEVASIVSRHDEDIDELFPQVWLFIGAVDYTDGRRGPGAEAPLFEPLDENTFRVATGFKALGERARALWHRQSSFATRPDSEATAVAAALLALTEDGGLRTIDAIRVYVRWRDSEFLRRRT